MKQKTAVEISHLYSDSVDGLFSIEQILPHVNDEAECFVLIDDYHVTPSINYQEAITPINTFKPTIVLESQMIGLTSYFLQRFQGSLVFESFRKGNRQVCFIVLNDDKIPLYYVDGNEVTYTCQFLSFCWTMWRAYQYENVVTLVSQKFETIESSVLTLVQHLSIMDTVSYQTKTFYIP